MKISRIGRNRYVKELTPGLGGRPAAQEQKSGLIYVTTNSVSATGAGGDQYDQLSPTLSGSLRIPAGFLKVGTRLSFKAVFEGNQNTSGNCQAWTVLSTSTNDYYDTPTSSAVNGEALFGENFRTGLDFGFNNDAVDRVGTICGDLVCVELGSSGKLTGSFQYSLRDLTLAIPEVDKQGYAANATTDTRVPLNTNINNDLEFWAYTDTAGQTIDLIYSEMYYTHP